MKLKNLLTHLTVLIKRNIKTGTSFMTAILLLLNTVMINAQNTYPELLNDQLLIHRFEGNFRNMINNALPCEQNPNIICLFKGGKRDIYDSLTNEYTGSFYKYNLCIFDTNLVIKDTIPLPELFSDLHGIRIPFMMGKTCFGFVDDFSDAMYHDDYICRSLFIRQNTDNKELYTNLLSKKKGGWSYSPFHQFCDSNFVMYRHIGRNLTSEEFSIMKIDTCGEIIDSAILQMPYPVNQFELHYSPILYNDQMTIFHNTIDSSVMYLLNDDFKITGRLSFPLRDPMSYVPGTCSYINLGDTILIKTMDSVSNSTLYSEWYTTTEVFVHFIDLDNLTVKKNIADYHWCPQ